MNPKETHALVMASFLARSGTAQTGTSLAQTTCAAPAAIANADESGGDRPRLQSGGSAVEGLGPKCCGGGSSAGAGPREKI